MKSGYSAADRFVHRLALGNLELQKSLSDIESRVHARRLAGIAIDRPVFITSLPRAGTTLLLEVVYETGAFASLTYRDMPFVLCPLLWHAIARGFRRHDERRERAHGDGMTVGYDSPEAFEEVLWKAYWPRHYAADHIRPWSAADRGGEFERAFVDHLRKVIAVRQAGGVDVLRYVAKNNANIARLPLLAALFPDGTFLVPFRNPADHAASLARQHQNFLARHAADPFSQRYMEWIGHYEFGRAFRPIAFAGTVAGGPDDADFWLHYWDTGFRHILATAPPRTVFIDYDALCENPRDGLAPIAAALGLPEKALQPAANRFHAASHYAAPDRSPLWPRAQETHRMLRERAAHAVPASARRGDHER